MGRLRKLLAVSFRAKVLVPVILVMVCLLGVTAWAVNKSITAQFEADARRALDGANESFSYWQRNRNKTFILRVGDLRNEPRFKAILGLNDFPTVRRELSELLQAAGNDVKIVFFTNNRGELMGSTNRGESLSAIEFAAASSNAVRSALRGEDRGETIRVGDKLYDIVSFGASDLDGNQWGALTFGMEISHEEAAEIGGFTRSEIVLLANDEVVISTLPTPDENRRLAAIFKDLSASSKNSNRTLDFTKAVFDGQHYYCASRPFSTSASSIGILLLYSYQKSWESLQKTQQILVAANAIAILLGSLIVCFLVGKVTQPLRELRDTAEAVGRGDFSRRVEVRSADECGELASVFNQMTHNIKQSRETLEATVETLKTTQAQLIQSEKLSGIGEFIAGVAHELNNPLTSVMGFSELLQNAEVPPKEKRYLDMVHKSALRCQKIVQALLGFARRTAPERKAVCLNKLVEAAVEILSYQLRTSNVEAVVDLAPDLPQAMVDPHQIQQVFVNLINNARQAIEAHQPKGVIKVTTSTAGENVRVIIQDNGPGISPENLSKIFDPFFTTKEVGKGTGLGLSLVYGIIKEHGGTITPRSRPGEGATFIIELPITTETADAEESAAPVVHMPNGHEGKGKRVLVIDDEEPILQMVREVLTPQGYEVDTASDGATALQRMSEKQYDVALCDWKMPGLNGQQVYERARTVSPALSHRMIFITGDIINDRTRKFLEQQNKVCLPKPFTIAEFRMAIKKVLEAE